MFGSIVNRATGAADAVQVEVIGAERLDAKFAALPEALQSQILPPAIHAAGAVVLARTKANCPVDKGDLRASLHLRDVSRPRNGAVAVVVQTGEGYFKGDQFYGGFVDLGYHHGARGSGDVARVRNGKLQLVKRRAGARKWIPGQHFMLRSAEEAGPEAQAVAIAQIRAGIVRVAAG